MDDHEERDVPVVDTQLRTGNPEVDGVLDSMDGLDDLPVAEHVAVFERAHEVLRGALDARPDA
jgi:hypothetical protein